MVFNGYIILRTTIGGIERIFNHMSASTQVAKASGHQVLCGPVVVPAGFAPVLVQAVLEGVDIGSLLHIVWKSIVIPDNPAADPLSPCWKSLGLMAWCPLAFLVVVAPSLFLSTSRSNHVPTLTLSLPDSILQVWIISPLHLLSSRVVKFNLISFSL